eukprot:15472442-Alexandrium_andersonii.AAC.1
MLPTPQRKTTPSPPPIPQSARYVGGLPSHRGVCSPLSTPGLGARSLFWVAVFVNIGCAQTPRPATHEPTDCQRRIFDR